MNLPFHDPQVNHTWELNDSEVLEGSGGQWSLFLDVPLQNHWAPYMAPLGVSAKFRFIINSITLINGPFAALNALESYVTWAQGVVLMAFDGRGPAKTCQEKIDILGQLWTLAKKAGFSDDDIYMDCALYPLKHSSSGNIDFLQETLQAISQAKAQFPHAQRLLGISNAVFGLGKGQSSDVQVEVTQLAFEQGLTWAMLSSKLPFG